MGRNLYQFISDGRDIDYRVDFVSETSFGGALIKFCKYYGIDDVHLEAIGRVSIDSAMVLANEWLSDRILMINEILPENILYGSKDVHERIGVI